MLSKEQEDKWITALRSGEYKQTTGRLFSGKGYCCIGVFCKAVEELNLPPTSVYDGGKNELHYDRIRKLIGQEFMSELIDMNDEGYSFHDIAEKIESE
ncbi:MAG TPA: hypothetical protein VNZ45_16600 [Bacteroidia bacterium]|jgi:hypothetical protein|nr:hypothetical protein [Bacteroidia bacterium]